MQTFLPYPDIDKSLEVLDYRRLGKQRVETFQLLNVLLDRNTRKGWKNHPICKMWKGYENALKHYFNVSVKKWIERGYNNNMKLEDIEGDIIYPEWFGNEKFHASHRSNLLRKDFDFYSKYGWNDNPDDPYQWFNSDTNSFYNI